MKRLLLGTAIAVLLSAQSLAPAQAAVSVRAGAHDDYARLVFDWPERTSYTVRQQDENTVVLTFDRPEDIAVEDVDLSGLASVQAIEDMKTGSSARVEITVVPQSRFRHFTIGNRVVLDIYYPEGMEKVEPAPQLKTPPKSESKPEPKPEPQTETQEEPVDEAVSSGEAAEPPVSSHDESESKALSDDAGAQEKISKEEEGGTSHEKAVYDLERASDALIVDEVNAPQVPPFEGGETMDGLSDPHAISLTLTEKVGLAAFKRAGYLWLVFDHPDLKVKPEIAGAQADDFGEVEDVKNHGGATVYRIQIPDALKDYHVYGEGGGLVWRVVFSQRERETHPAKMGRTFLKDEMVRGGTLLWALRDITKMISFDDPFVGDRVTAVTVADSGKYTRDVYRFPAFETLPSVVGMAIVSHVDDLDVTRSPNGVQVTRPGGLALSRDADVSRSIMREEIKDIRTEDLEQEEEIRRIFDFDRWMMGGIQALGENQTILLSGMASKDKNGQIQDLLTLAKMNVANDRGQEALGFLRYAAQEMPVIVRSPEYLALRGAANALAGKYEEALQDFVRPVLNEYSELDYWRAYTLAWLEDWYQAQHVMPHSFGVLIGYPKSLQEKLGLKLAEVALRNADVMEAETILSFLHRERIHLQPSTVAGLDYLKGEAHRQSGEYDQMRALWEPLSKGHDDLYRVKAGLALTLLDMQTDDLSLEKAIDRLEGLRYGWRGDELEAKTNFTLGQLYLQSERYVKGLGILREAAAMTPDSEIGHEITAYMKDFYKTLLVDSESLNPLDAATLYEEFTELTPPGEEGNKLIQKLAERLVEADLLERSAKLLQHQVDFRLSGDDRARVAKRLVAIYLLDKNPKDAIRTLDKTKDDYEKAGDARQRRDFELLRARALSQLGRAEEAIELLNGFDPDPKVNSLRADIAWRAGLWEAAAEAIHDLILDEELDMSKPLTEEQAALILNRAVALNLSSNRVALANERERYQERMKKTAQARLFDVVTRHRNTTLFADKDTIEALVSEVDLFKEFLNSYRQEDTETAQ